MKGSGVFIDILLCFVVVIMAILSLIKAQITETQESAERNAIYQIVIEWDGKSESDVDLWVRDPKGHIVGFNRREGGEGSLMALDRDDLGSLNDKKEDGSILEVNKEIVNIRALFIGEYTATAHFYVSKEEMPPLEVRAKLVKIKPFREIVSNSVELLEDGDEEVLFRFFVDENDNVDDINYLPANIADQS